MTSDRIPALKFYDSARGEAALTFVGSALWLCFRHPDGQFVTERPATEADLERLASAIDEQAAHVRELMAQVAPLRDMADALAFERQDILQLRRSCQP